MRESLLSPQWYRVAGQRPALRGDIRVERQLSRDQNWYVLVNQATGRQFRISDRAYQVLGRCDGQRSTQQIWESLIEQQQDAAPTQHELLALLSQLDQQGVLAYEGVPDIDALVRDRDERVQRRRRGFLNPFAFQVALGNPSVILKRLQALGRVLLHPLTLAVWIVAMIASAAAAAVNWPTLALHASAYLDTPRYLLLAWLTFPFIKALHELAHGLAVRHWGGEVTSAGITLFVLTPAPYVDASASAAFRARYQRGFVSAIGIMVELAVAALGLLVWLNVQPGTTRDIAFVTMVTASVSTVLFNGNPLLRFDAYYAFCDALDLPNLATRSSTYWLERLKRYTFGIDVPTSVELTRGERKWLIAYAPLSAVYRLFVCTAVVLWAGGHSLVLGTLAAAYVLVTLVCRPAYQALRCVLTAAPDHARWRARGVAAGVMLSAFSLLCLVPVPFHTVARAVVSLPDEAQVRAGTDGFVLETARLDGEEVEAGQVLVVMHDPLLHARRAHAASEREQIRTDVATALLRDRSRSRDYELELARIDGELRDLDERIEKLQVRAQVSGRLVLPRREDLPGSFVKRGATLGYILARSEVMLRAAVPEADAALVRESTRSVEVRLAERAGTELRAALVRDVPASTRELPSAALSDRGGGPFVTAADDKDGRRVSEPVVLVDLAVSGVQLERAGARAWVRFDHGAEPLAGQWYRRGRQLLLQHFNPTS